VCINLLQRENNIDVPVLKLVVDTVGTDMRMRTFDMGVEAYLGGIYFQHLKFKGRVLLLILLAHSFRKCLCILLVVFIANILVLN
jgi:hypothetical protein